MRQVAQVVLEGGEAGDQLPVEAKGRGPVGEALLGVGDDLPDCLPEVRQRGALGLLEPDQVGVDLLL